MSQSVTILGSDNTKHRCSSHTQNMSQSVTSLGPDNTKHRCSSHTQNMSQSVTSLGPDNTKHTCSYHTQNVSLSLFQCVPLGPDNTKHTCSYHKQNLSLSLFQCAPFGPDNTCVPITHRTCQSVCTISFQQHKTCVFLPHTEHVMLFLSNTKHVTVCTIRPWKHKTYVPVSVTIGPNNTLMPSQMSLVFLPCLDDSRYVTLLMSVCMFPLSTWSGCQ